MASTRIEWADRVWNPITGCTKCSPACDNCYAERMSKRLAGRCGYPADDPFRVTLHEDKLTEPLRWTKPARIFVGSMTDLFHEDVREEWLDRIFAVMERCPQHIFMLLTKRPERMAAYLEEWHPLSGVWLGTTIWDQDSADRAVPLLLSTPAAKRFVSVEPMLGPVNLGFTRGPRNEDYNGYNGDGPIDYVITSRADDLHWVICGGETGPGARPMHPDWPRSLRDQCQAAEVPFFFKQWGEWVGLKSPNDGTWPTDSGSCIRLTPDGLRADDGYPMQRVGKKFAGREMDGQEWSEVPHAS